MANRAYLINSSSLTSNPAELERLRDQPGHVDGEVASSANRLLIPWFLCFRRGDLRPVHCNFMPLELPCTSLEQAVRNLEESLPVFEAIAGDAALARPYWELACARLRGLPLPYLSMDPTEVLQMGMLPPLAIAQHLVGALSGDLAAVPSLKALANYEDKAAPYPLEVLYAMPGGKKQDRRIWNASVLDGGFNTFVRWRKKAGTAEPALPPGLPDSLFGELYDVPDLLKAWLAKASPSAVGAELGLWPGETEQLQIDIYTRSDEDAAKLQAHAELRRQLEELASTRLQPWCQKHGFGWNGCVLSAPEWARN
ncbi:MAG: hypothetical protein EOO25_15220 [Comamonadaceae bacterium]|nr:MAG: hypothetical protein EOO25_15220 [Comamonadaceae bacterium]